MLRCLVLVMVCSLFVPSTDASAKCVVKGKATLTVKGKAKVSGETSKIRGSNGGKAHLEGWDVHTRGLFRTRIGSFTREGPMIERALTRARPIDFGDGRASVKRGVLEKYTFSWDPDQCTTSEAALGAIHLTWYLDEHNARSKAQ